MTEHLSGAPEFFRRVWDTTGVPPVRTVGDEDPIARATGKQMVVITPQTGRLIIFGRLTPSPYPEDVRQEKRAWEQRGSFPAHNYSVLCPDGEYGMVPVSDVEPITEAEFNAARERGWRDA